MLIHGGPSDLKSVIQDAIVIIIKTIIIMQDATEKTNQNMPLTLHEFCVSIGFTSSLDFKPHKGRAI